MPDLRRFGQTLSQILPFLAKEKMQREQIRRYLESNLQENAAREATAGRLQTQEASDAASKILLGMLGKFYENKLGGPEMAPGAFKAAVPGLTAGIEELPGAAAKLEEAKNAFTDMTAQFQADQEITPQVTRVLSTQLPPNEMLDMYKAAKLAGLTRGGQALTEKGQAIDIAGQEIRKGELAAQESKVTGEKGKTTEIKALLSSTQQQIGTLQKQLELGAFGGLSGVDQPAVQAQVEALSKKVDTYRNYLEEKILADPKLKDTDYLAVIEGLKAKNWNKFRFMSNPEFQTTMLLNGYAITKLIQLWK